MVLRPPRLRDADDWRRVRMADQARIEPFWDHSDLTWAERHTRRAWARECFEARQRMRRGDCVHTVIVVNDQLAGQCDAWLDRYHGRGEIGGWVHSYWTGKGVGTTAVGLLVDYAFAELALERVISPTACGNDAPARIMQKLGFMHEGVMRSYMKVGDSRRDHDLWSQTREDWIALSDVRAARTGTHDRDDS